MGLACWDLDGDGAASPGEDTNGDGLVDALDCRVAPQIVWVDADGVQTNVQGDFADELLYWTDDSGIIWCVSRDGQFRVEACRTDWRMELWYTMPNCQGDAFLDIQDHPLPGVAVNATNESAQGYARTQVVWLPTTVGTTIAAQSVLQNGNCLNTGGYGVDVVLPTEFVEAGPPPTPPWTPPLFPQLR